jgi:diazepam-binding inhibitor (GABA receptor modulating acyl-CoA-binding protein)
MTDLTQRFEQAATDSKSLDSRPDNMTMMKLYGLYKQGAQGDNTSEAPGDMIGKFKHKAWSELKGVSKEDAMQRYIDLVESLR